NGCYANVVDLFDGAGAGAGTETSFSCNKAENDFTKWRVGLGLLDWNGFSLTGIFEQQKDLPTTANYVTYSDPRLSPLSYNLPSGPDERNLWQVQAGYAFGNWMVKAMYGESEFSGSYALPDYTQIGVTGGNAALYNSIANNHYDGQTNSWAFGVDYNFSKRTQVYALYTATTSDQGDTPAFTDNVAAIGAVQPAIGVREWDGFSIGMMHSF
ncbi:MAG TPA: porin, partial [Lamprocystis sp. (in: g-proteobacteria)]|nr:porin [Lamprocystis sp. (in: g-proteobacteria)]